MTADQINPAFIESSPASTQPELLVSSVLHLMSHYTAHASESGDCIKLASVIERHLKALSSLPSLAPVLRATCQQLSEQWAAVVERAMPKPEKINFFTRLAAGRPAN